ncbi:MAG: exonuclease SbcCD subunit D C-terminal domain-containing protein [Bacteroidota bacterium]
MRVLHTSDWHLGQKFQHHDRRLEHQMALDWLLETIRTKKIDVLLVAGDIFDVGNPPNYARQMYYRFLTQVVHTTCRHVVIIAGNHDSPSMLAAPKDLLLALNVHIVSRANSERPEKELLELRNQQQHLEAVIAAVPFLRDQDLRKSISGEFGLERKQAIQAAIKVHFETVAKVAETYRTSSPDIPIIAMGHLFVKNAETPPDKRNNIYMGDTENIETNAFSSVFDYVALGHIHRPQCMDAKKRIQYSGSLIPLSFSERADKKVVKILDFQGRNFQICTLAVPSFRRLKKIERQNLEEIKARLTQLNADYAQQLPVWVEVVLTDPKFTPDLEVQLADYTKEMNLEILNVRTASRQYDAAGEELTLANLHDLTPLEVFERKLAQSAYQEDEEKRGLILDTFKELQSWMKQQETF